MTSGGLPTNHCLWQVLLLKAMMCLASKKWHQQLALGLTLKGFQIAGARHGVPRICKIIDLRRARSIVFTDTHPCPIRSHPYSHRCIYGHVHAPLLSAPDAVHGLYVHASLCAHLLCCKDNGFSSSKQADLVPEKVCCTLPKTAEKIPAGRKPHLDESVMPTRPATTEQRLP